MTFIEDTLSPATMHTALQVAELPDVVRGYEEVKLGSVGQYRARLVELRQALEGAGES